MQHSRLDTPLSTGDSPPWASGWGEDQYGIFVDITVEDASQRLRWISPGQFEMGTPATEYGRSPRDQSLHIVSITRGFWLFDTPVTQNFWSAVFGKPKVCEFPGDQRPVERVSWTESLEFCKLLEARLPGVRVSLPTEQEWEYACRAATQTTTYAGNLTNNLTENFRLLDSIAWFADNSRAVPDPRHPTRLRCTQEVALKQPNPWGLYDMLGNVWEWCLDPWLMPAEDPRTSLNHRVIRGASWFYRDSEIRAGNRGFNEENDRNFDLGFRCCLEADPATNKMKRDDRACEKLVFREYLDETDKLLEQWLLSVGKTLKEFRTADEHGPVSPIQIATEVIRSLDTKSKTMGCKMQIESKMKDEESLVWGSANSIFEILEVLVVNALEARSRVVSIVCTIGTATSRMHNNNYVDLWVVDDGDGIAVEDYGNVKKPFFTSKNRSTGLGLAIADLLALDMGGSLELRSGGRAAGEDKTCWVVRLPLYVSANQRHHS